MSVIAKIIQNTAVTQQFAIKGPAVMISDDNSSDILTFKKPLRCNNICYREKLSLNAGNILKPRVLASNYVD